MQTVPGVPDETAPAWKSVEFTGTWTQTDIDNLQVRLEMSKTASANTGSLYVYALYAQVKYVPTPSLANHTDFGTLDVTDIRDRTFTIRNDGNATLTISSVSVSPTTYFSILSGVGDTTLDANQSVTFVVRFDPPLGVANATVTIASDDADEGTFTFPVRGTGIDAGTQGDWRPTYPQPWREHDLVVGV